MRFLLFLSLLAFLVSDCFAIQRSEVQGDEEKPTAACPAARDIRLKQVVVDDAVEFLQANDMAEVLVAWEKKSHLKNTLLDLSPGQVGDTHQKCVDVEFRENDKCVTTCLPLPFTKFAFMDQGNCDGGEASFEDTDAAIVIYNNINPPKIGAATLTRREKEDMKNLLPRFTERAIPLFEDGSREEPFEQSLQSYFSFVSATIPPPSSGISGTLTGCEHVRKLIGHYSCVGTCLGSQVEQLSLGVFKRGKCETDGFDNPIAKRQLRLGSLGKITLSYFTTFPNTDSSNKNEDSYPFDSSSNNNKFDWQRYLHTAKHFMGSSSFDDKFDYFVNHFKRLMDQGRNTPTTSSRSMRKNEGNNEKFIHSDVLNALAQVFQLKEDPLDGRVTAVRTFKNKCFQLETTERVLALSLGTLERGNCTNKGFSKLVLNKEVDFGIAIGPLQVKVFERPSDKDNGVDNDYKPVKRNDLAAVVQETLFAKRELDVHEADDLRGIIDGFLHHHRPTPISSQEEMIDTERCCIDRSCSCSAQYTSKELADGSCVEVCGSDQFSVLPKPFKLGPCKIEAPSVVIDKVTRSRNGKLLVGRIILKTKEVEEDDPEEMMEEIFKGCKNLEQQAETIIALCHKGSFLKWVMTNARNSNMDVAIDQVIDPCKSIEPTGKYKTACYRSAVLSAMEKAMHNHHHHHSNRHENSEKKAATSNADWKSCVPIFPSPSTTSKKGKGKSEFDWRNYLPASEKYVGSKEKKQYVAAPLVFENINNDHHREDDEGVKEECKYGNCPKGKVCFSGICEENVEQHQRLKMCEGLSRCPEGFSCDFYECGTKE